MKCEPCTWWHIPPEKIGPTVAHYEMRYADAKIALCEKHAASFDGHVKNRRLAGTMVWRTQ